MKKKLLIMSDGFYPITGGANYVIFELVKKLKIFFDVIVISRYDKLDKTLSLVEQTPVYRVHWSKLNNRLHPGSTFYKIYKKLVLRKVVSIIKKNSIPNCLISVYPTAFFIDIALEIKKLFPQIFLISYFHDLLAPSYVNDPNNLFYTNLENSIVKISDQIAVINNSMVSYFLKSYGIKPLVVPFPIDDLNPLQECENIGKASIKIGWAGNVHNGNIKSLSRLLKLINLFENTEIILFTNSKLDFWEEMRSFENLNIYYTHSRKEYLSMLRRQSFLIVSLDWPDESPLGEVELRNALPTKVIDYIAAGRPIISHSPDYYYLSNFVSSNRIGYVINSRNNVIMKKNLEKIFFSLRGRDISPTNFQIIREKMRMAYENAIENIRKICL